MRCGVISSPTGEVWANAAGDGWQEPFVRGKHTTRGPDSDAIRGASDSIASFSRADVVRYRAEIVLERGDEFLRGGAEPASFVQQFEFETTAGRDQKFVRIAFQPVHSNYVVRVPMERFSFLQAGRAGEEGREAVICVRQSNI